MGSYDLNEYLYPVWLGNNIYGESVFPLKTESGEEVIPLLYSADEILEVRSATLKKLFELGKDYLLRDGSIVIPEGSEIPVMPPEEYYPDHVKVDESFWRTGGGYIAYTPADHIHNAQAAVTYSHCDKWTGPVPESKLHLLPKLKSRLENKEPVKVLFYGDSITCGYNSSGKVGAEPFLPDWTELVMAGLELSWPETLFTSENTSVPGQSSDWGAREAENRGAVHKPDIAVIAFGMNDGTHRVSAEAFQSNIKAIIECVKGKNPDCEFLLLSTSLANPEVLLFNERQRQPGEDPCVMDYKSFAGNQTDFLPALLELEKSGAIVADMTTMHQYLLSKKRFRDLSGNNVNHPNDFFARIHAQVILAALGAGL